MATLAPVKRTSHIVEYVPEAGKDINLRELFADGLVLAGVHAFLSSANDHFTIRDGVGGARMFKAKDTNQAGIMIPCFDIECKPFMLYSECAFSTPAQVLITFYVKAGA